MKWIQVSSTKADAEQTDGVDYAVPPEPNAGKVVTLSPGKPHRPEDFYNEKFSEVERICDMVYKNKFVAYKHIELQINPGISFFSVKGDGININASKGVSVSSWMRQDFS
jgi:hypothetical protein